MANGDVWASEREGLDAGQAATQYGLLNRANNALVAQYGPEAGNPVAQSQEINNNYLGQLDPLLVQQQAVTTGTAQALQPSSIAAGKAQNAGIVQQVPYQVQNAAATAAQNTATATTSDVAAKAAVGAQHAVAAVAAANDMTAHLAANPADKEGAWQAGIAAANLKAPGEGDAFANTPQGKTLHAQFLTDPQGAINGINSSVQSGIQAMQQTMSPAQWLEFQKSNADLANVNADRLTKAQASAKESNANVDSILGNQGPIGAAIVQGNSTLDRLKQMRDVLGGMSDESKWNDAVAKYIPGSSQQQLTALAESVNASLSGSLMAGAREAGGSATGIRSTKEFTAAGDAIAKIDPAMSKNQILASITDAEKAIKAYQSGASGILAGPNGSDEYRQALARKRQTDTNLNSLLGGYQPAAGSTPAAASPAAPVSPTGAAGSTPASPTPRIGGATASTGPAIGTFDAALSHTFGAEGGYNAADANGAPVNMGINQGAHPDVDVKNLTRPQAAAIYKRDYWDAIGGDDLAKTNPGMAHAGFDIAVVDGAPKASALIKEAGGDPNKLVDLQQQFQNGLIAKDPSRYGKYADVWQKRNQALKDDIASGTVGNAYAGSGGGAAAPTAGGGLAAMPAPIAAPVAAPNVDPNAGRPPAPIASAAPAQNAAQPGGPAFQVGPVASAAEDPVTGHVARAFAGERSQVMAGRALIAKYLGKVVNA